MTGDQAIDISTQLTTALLALKSARKHADPAFSAERGDIPIDLELVRAIDIIFNLEIQLRRFLNDWQLAL